MSAEFIKLVSDLHRERFNMHLEQLAKNQTPCGIFFGFEVIPSNAAADIQMLQKVPLNVSCAIVLADVQADALKNFVDVPVITLEDFERFGEENFPVKPQEVFLIGELKDCAFVPYFARYGIEIIAPDCATDQRKFFLDMMDNLPKLYAVHEMLASDESKKVFRAAVKCRLTDKISDCIFAPEAQYFLEGFTPTAGDIAIDGGAYDGSTALAFAKCGAKVFAFEMDATNFQNCAARLGGDYDITLENLGLSDTEGTANYFSGGAGSNKNSNGTLTAQFIDLDTYVVRKNLPRVDYIKLDIEGAELEMLHGAAQTIKRCKPKMAISAYHRPNDLWTLALYIKSLRPDYEFEFRHYRIDCTDYFLNDEQRAILKYFGLDYFIESFCEMILYCR